MTDDVRDALVRFAKYCRKFSDDEARVYDHNADDIEAALAHIDGEPARTAAAVAAKAEEVRASCAQAAERASQSIDAVAAERDALRAQVAEAAERLDEFSSQPTLADGIQAMRLRLVELRAQVATLETAYAALAPETLEKWRRGELTAGEMISFGHETGLLARTKVLEAQMEAVRTLAEEFSNDTFDGGGETAAAGDQMLAVMDGAKP